MSRSRILLAALLLLLAALAGPAAATEPPRVLSVRAGEAGPAQVVLELERRAEPLVFTLDEPMRLVVELDHARWALQQAPAAQGIAAGWRFGRKDGRAARMIVDLAQPARVRRVAYEIGTGRGGARLVIDLEPVSRSTFTAEAQGWSRTSDLLKEVYTPPAAPRRAAAQAALPQPGSAQPAAVRPQAAAGPGGPAGASPNRPEAPPPVVADPPAPARAEAARPQAPASPPRQEAAAVPRPQPAAPRGQARRVVVIDPGHGGQDPGAVGASGTFEKTITLAVSRDLRQQLEQTGRYRVHLTRDGDYFMPLRDRVQRARNLKAELFVSIHADSMGSSETRGASVYTLSDTASDAETAALAARENRADIIAGVDLRHESREVANILIDLAQRETMNRSAGLAHLLVREMGRDVLMLPVRPHRFAGFAVLKAPDVPSALVELGYLSNRQDENLLKQPAHRKRVAAAIQRAIDAYFAGEAPR
ncbi:MAG: N-acetylmuramoyl-L-alanine amidase [Alphaproteobacteria bacterium]|nr:N-acetylmuramoyl-L-alanine amidase [Alphaproteobacteria bacterium]